MMHHRGMLYDRESQPCSTGVSIVTPIYPIEAFKDSSLIFFGNADAGVAYP